MSKTLAVIGGWAQFGLQLLSQFSTGTTPHGWGGWLTFAGSLAAAIGIHAASNTANASQVNPSK